MAVHGDVIMVRQIIEFLQYDHFVNGLRYLDISENGTIAGLKNQESGIFEVTIREKKIRYCDFYDCYHLEAHKLITLKNEIDRDPLDNLSRQFSHFKKLREQIIITLWPRLLSA